MRNTLTLSFILSSAVFLAACSSTPIAENKAPVEDRTATAKKDTTAAAAQDSRTVATVTTPAKTSDNGPQGALAYRSVYFGYDSYAVVQESVPVVEAHAKHLVATKGQKIVIQGNADERGGREYNLALGQKRAEAVRKALVLLNVPESQIEAVSFGKEKPKAQGHDEAAWAENRRADIVY